MFVLSRKPVIRLDVTNTITVEKLPSSTAVPVYDKLSLVTE